MKGNDVSTNRHTKEKTIPIIKRDKLKRTNWAKSHKRAKNFAHSYNVKIVACYSSVMWRKRNRMKSQGFWEINHYEI